MSTYRKSQRYILRKRYGSRALKKQFKGINSKPVKKQSALVRGVRNIINLLKGRNMR